MHRSWHVSALLVLSAMALYPAEAGAIPAFARKYGLACSACHEVWPKLNDFGQLFRDNGYRLEREKDLPVTQPFAYWPVAIRTTAGYQYTAQTQVASDQGPTTTQLGHFGFTGLDLLTAGTLGEHTSFLVVFTPGLNSAGFNTGGNEGADLESAFIGFHDIADTSYFNLRVGKHAPDLPIDEHRVLTLTQGYNIYHFHPQGSVLEFEPGENQTGIEVFGHSELSRFRYSVSFVNGNDVPIQRGIVANPLIWAHVAGTIFVENDFLGAVKLGLFGAVGWRSTTNNTITDAAGGVTNVLGTGMNMRAHERIGAEAHLLLLSTINPLTVSGVVLFGNEDAGLVPGGVRDARWFGGFIEGSYTWSPTWTVLARYERITSLAASTDDTPVSEGDLSVVTGMLRHTIELSNRAALAFQAEVSYAQTTVSSAAAPPAGTTVLLALDFAY